MDQKLRSIVNGFKTAFSAELAEASAGVDSSSTLAELALRSPNQNAAITCLGVKHGRGREANRSCSRVSLPVEGEVKVVQESDRERECLEGGL